MVLLVDFFYQMFFVKLSQTKESRNKGTNNN